MTHRKLQRDVVSNVRNRGVLRTLATPAANSAIARASFSAGVIGRLRIEPGLLGFTSPRGRGGLMAHLEPSSRGFGRWTMAASDRWEKPGRL